MDDWDKLDQQFSGGKPAAAPVDAWAALDASFAKPQAAPAGVTPAKPAAENIPDPTIGQRIKAGLAGINKGFYTDLLGLPVDTVSNVLDLGRAGVGTVANAAGHPEFAPDIPDRSTIVGSGEWLAAKLNKAGMGQAINNPRPDDAVSRVLHSGGRAGGASIIPVRSLPMRASRQAMNVGGGALSGVLAGTAAEVSDDPAVAVLAGMSPAAAARGGAGALRRVVRGGDAGAQNMRQRIQDFKNGGVDAPSVGLASGNGFVQGVENLLAQTPGSTGIFQRSKDAMLDGMKRKSNQIRDEISPAYGALDAGSAIQKDIGGHFIDRFKATQGRLYDKVDAIIPGASKTQVPATTTALEELNSGIQGAPNLGNRFINGRISDINDAFRVDAGIEKRPGPLRTYSFTDQGKAAIPGLPGRPSSTVTRTIDPHGQRAGEGAPKAQRAMNAQNTPRKQIMPVSALPRTVSLTTPAVPASPGVPARPSSTVTRTIDPHNVWAGEGTWRPAANPSLPYQAVSKLRTQVGQELDGNMLTSDVPRSQWKRLYGSLSQDIGGAASTTGPDAVQAWDRANTYTKRGISRIEDLQTIANKSTPEGAYNSIASSLNAGPTAFERVRNSVTPGTRQKIVSTVISDLGTATPGQQGAAGTDWSPRTFLTNYNKLDPRARAALFTRLPGGKSHAENLADIAKTADMIGQGSKVWANPSGTAAALSARATLGGISVGALYSPVLAAGTAASLVGANAASRLLTNPIFANWLAKAPEANPQKLQAYAQRLVVNAKSTKDAQFQQDVDAYLGSVGNQLDDSVSD